MFLARGCLRAVDTDGFLVACSERLRHVSHPGIETPCRTMTIPLPDNIGTGKGVAISDLDLIWTDPSSPTATWIER